ncbi:type II/IV secretion system protein [Candidatus Peregrinibacteria bacterium]|nr:type II/IV secretion system protein [Candidatus Peregrinibacteria bacterium]
MSIDEQKLGQALLDSKLLDKKTLVGFISSAKSKNISLEDVLFERELIPDAKLGATIAGLYGVPFVKLSDKSISEPLLRIVPYALASSQYVIPFERTSHELSVALNDPHNYELSNFLEKKTGLAVKPFYANKRDIKAALKAYNRNVNEQFTKLLKSALKDPTKIESLKDAAKILDAIILFAYQNNASDIHIEPHKDFLAIRYRVDGILQIIAELPSVILELLVTRIKVLANLRTDEHRSSQDGRFKIDLQNNEITMRVSIVPTYDGEKTVLRLLSSSNQALDLESLGYSPRDLQIIRDNIEKTHGMILITGPTGSGKTTTLYSVLKVLNSPEINISTIEDPIEYRLEGVNQIQVNNVTNLTFASGLRTLLRQDPDVIMVGEIRDEETAGIAINAALTGHLVLATLHTNDVAATLPRLVDMGIEPFLVSATVNMVSAQRLLRTICKKCKTSYVVTKEKIATLEAKLRMKEDLRAVFRKATAGAESFTLYTGVGCAACGGSGFKGRTSINEVMEVSDGIRKLILENASPSVIEEQAKKEGMTFMFEDGMRKILAGETTIEEILRVMRS